jgi:hypothetical protein
MFRKGQCVHSRFNGFGQVLADGESPVVRFLDGLECQVPEESVSNMPEEDFEAEIANRSMIESYLTIRVYGREALGPDGCLWVRDSDGLWISAERLRQRPTHPPGTMPYFLPDDLGRDARVINPDELSDDDDVVDCTVTRVPEDDGQVSRPPDKPLLAVVPNPFGATRSTAG